MSKYIKLEDAIEHTNQLYHGYEVEKWLESLPTIEVMEYPQVDGITPTVITPEVGEEDELKFYYVDSIDDYWIGRRLDNFYYAEWEDRLGFVWSKSRYLPWGEHVVAPDTLWKEHTYPSEPREIPFTEWIVGFMKKRGIIPQPKEGEWLLDGRCSNCLQVPLTTHKTYCPNCGAKMKGAKR